MYGIRINTKLSPASIQTMNEFAKTFSEKVQNRVFKNAGKKASEAMVERIKSHMPYNKNPLYSRPHMRDVVAYKVKTYKESGRTLFIMGYQSRMTNLQTLVEKGNFLTSPRMTRHESNSIRKVMAGKMVRRREKYQRADGSWRYGPYKLVQQAPNLRSTGSKYRGSGKALNRGDFPRSKQPFAPITTAAREMRNTIIDIMETEIAAGFKRAFAREAGSH